MLDRLANGTKYCFKCISILFTILISLNYFWLGLSLWDQGHGEERIGDDLGAKEEEEAGGGINVGIHLITLRCLPRLILSESCSTGTLMVCWTCDQADLFSVQQHWHSELRVLEHHAAEWSPVCRNQGWDELNWAVLAWLFRLNLDSNQLWT